MEENRNERMEGDLRKSDKMLQYQGLRSTGERCEKVEMKYKQTKSKKKKKKVTTCQGVNQRECEVSNFSQQKAQPLCQDIPLTAARRTA